MRSNEYEVMRLNEGAMPTEDLELILQRGCFDIHDETYCQRDGTDGLRLLPRGLRLLRVSFLLHFCDPSPANGVTSVGAYRDCALTIKRVRLWRASDEAHKARTGYLPADALGIAKAAREGGIEDLHRATAARLAQVLARQSLQNVTYVDFRTRERVSLQK